MVNPKLLTLAFVLVYLTSSSLPLAEGRSRFRLPRLPSVNKLNLQDVQNIVDQIVDDVSDTVINVVDDADDTVNDVINDVSNIVGDVQDTVDETEEGVEAAEDVRDQIVTFLIDLRACFNGDQDMCQELTKRFLALEAVQDLMDEGEEWIKEQLTIKNLLDFYVLLLTEYPEVLESLPVEEIVNALIQSLFNSQKSQQRAQSELLIASPRFILNSPSSAFQTKTAARSALTDAIASLIDQGQQELTQNVQDGLASANDRYQMLVRMIEVLVMSLNNYIDQEVESSVVNAVNETQQHLNVHLTHAVERLTMLKTCLEGEMTSCIDLLNNVLTEDLVQNLNVQLNHAVEHLAMINTCLKGEITSCIELFNLVFTDDHSMVQMVFQNMLGNMKRK